MLADVSAIGQRIVARLANIMDRSHQRVRIHAPDAPKAWASEGAEKKSSATGPLIAFQNLHRPVWTPRDYQAFAREGFMQNAIVYRCVRMISESAASVPLLLYDRDTEIEDHPLLRLISRPNPFQAGPDLLENLFGFLLISGNSYIEAVSIDGEVRELHALRPDRMKVIPGPDGWPEAYEYTVGGRSIRLADSAVPGMRAVFHMRQFHADNDHYGMSPLEAASTAIDLHNTAVRWNQALLDNSARPSGALVYTARDGNLTAEQYERLKSELVEGFQGSANAGRPLLLEGGLDWKSMSLSPKDMDFIEARHTAAREIALALGVPPMLLGIPGDNTYSNMAEAQRMFWRQTVLPLVERTAKALNHWLAPAFGDTLDLRPDLDQLPALAPEREALWSSLEKTSFLTDNEKRALIGYGPRPPENPAAKANFNPAQLRDGGGRWAGGGDDDGLDSLVQPVQNRRRGGGGQQGGGGSGRRIGRDDNNPPGPVPAPPILPPSAPDTPPDSPGGGDDPPEFLKKKPGPGSLTGDLERITQAERDFAQELLVLGNHVRVVQSSATGRSPDFEINGKLYELKTVSGVQRTDADGLSSAISNRIMNGRGQSSDIIVDARTQTGMTKEVADRAIGRAYGLDNKTKQSIQSVTIMTSKGISYAPRRN